MPYTLWSRDTHVGDTDFSLGEQTANRRVGVFQPTAPGLMLLPGITDMAPALLALNAVIERDGLSDDDMERLLQDDEWIERMPEMRRMMASARHISDLQLRDPDGRPLAVESILVSDLDELKRLATADDDQHDDEPAEGAAPEPSQPPEPVRFIISVTLASSPAPRLV